MSKLYSTKIFWMIMSVLLSLGIWIYVTSVETDEISRTFTNVKVELVGEESLRAVRNLVVTDLDTDSVTVTVQGPRRVLGSLKSSELTARVDVSKLSRSAYTRQDFTLFYPNGTDTTDLTTMARTPDSVGFMVSRMESKTIPVRGTFNSSPAEGFAAEPPVFEPAEITVSGAEVYLKNVSYAWVVFEKEGVDSTYSVEADYTLMDENGDTCDKDGFVFDTDTVVATLPILGTKEVPLTVNLIAGGGAEENKNVTLTIEPETVMLVGDSAVLSGLDKIVLDTIDLKSFQTTFSGKYVIPLDSSLKVQSGATEAAVTVEIHDLTTKTFKVTNIACQNVTEGFEAIILTESLDIVLRGPEESIKQVKSANIRAVADLKDFDESTGSYMPVVKVYVDGFTDVGALGENTISVEIRKAQQ